MRVLHAASELHPFSKTGGLADMVSALAHALASAGHSVDVVTPLYRGLKARFPGLQPAGWQFDVRLGGSLVSGRFLRLDPAPGLRLWFVEQSDFFDRPGLYNEHEVDYPDNAARFAFLSKAALLLARHVSPRMDLIQCHDWQTGLLPVLVHHARVTGGWPAAPRTLFTIHNLAYQGSFPPEQWALSNLPGNWFHLESALHHGFCNFLKGGLALADALSTVSPTYAREICTPEYGCGLDGLLRRREYELTGILNGVDYGEWTTVNNPALPHAYDADHMEGKTANKQALQEELGLAVRPDLPLLANITRLTGQKGADLQWDAINDLLASGGRFQFALLGSGNPAMEAAYGDLARRYPGVVAATIGFDPQLAHRMEAGADFYLMPSRFEPCGLNQLYSLRYGTIPVVRATGGLQDSVVDPRDSPERATGIKFQDPTAPALATGIRKALRLHREADLLLHFRRNGMEADFSWEKQAREYVELYEHVIHGV
ncbi:MAG: glycogen synthase GlgA [Verrucomicrobiae bacterium]|nr:glycogen synthase GlgA [Verrucomicrobiae bacterium]